MRVDPKFMYCVFAHVTDEGAVHISCGHISAAFNPAFKIYGVVPFTVEIMSLHPTLVEASRSVPAKALKAPGVPVRCIETGGIYPSASAAARACNAHPSNMATHLNGGTPKKLKGYTFERCPGYDGPTVSAELPALKEARSRHVLSTDEVIAARERINGK